MRVKNKKKKLNETYERNDKLIDCMRVVRSQRHNIVINIYKMNGKPSKKEIDESI